MLEQEAIELKQEIIKEILSSYGIWGILISILIGLLIFIILRLYFPKMIAKQLEIKKAELEKARFIHELQFNMEFETYKQIWIELRRLAEATDIANPVIEFSPPDNKQEEERDNLVKLQEKLNKVNKTLGDNKPFYNIKIYEASRKLVHVSLRELIEGRHANKNNPKYMEKAEDRLNEITRAIHEIEMAIRKQVGTHDDTT